MGEIILFTACLCSFSAVLISLLFFLRFKKTFFFHVLLILLSFFLISTNNIYALMHAPITNRIALCILGAFLSLCFSFGIISFTFDLIHISPTAQIRKAFFIYSATVFVFAVIMIFIPGIEKPAFVLNLLGLWIPTGISLIIGIIFHKRIDTGVFRKENGSSSSLRFWILCFLLFCTTHRLSLSFQFRFWFTTFSIVFIFLRQFPKPKKLCRILL